MNSCELSITIAALANIIAQNLDDEALALVSAIFLQLGDTLETIAAKRSLCGNSAISEKNA